jgi:hypothetical protein
MAARIGRFSKGVLLQVRAGRGSWAVCDGVLLAEGKLRVVVDRAYQLHEAAAHDLIKGYVALQKSLGLGWLHDRSGAIIQHAGQSSAARAPFGRSSWRPTGFASPRAGPLRCRISKFGRRARFGGTGTGLDWGPFPSRQ